MANVQYEVKETISADGNATNDLISSGGPVLLQAQCLSGTGDVTFSKSIDSGSTFKDLSLAQFTSLTTNSDHQEVRVDSGEGDIFRATVANSASSPSFRVKMILATVRTIGNRR